ncbi:MAG TPA: ABC transporter substrate-binding protein [Anaeromyxobacteraceae bacterium]|nr:ABC transporter substrate-binding protein [Anaeromyxobacteraceae bacterium]
MTPVLCELDVRVLRPLAMLAASLALTGCPKKGEEALAPAGAPQVAVRDRILLGHVASMTGSEATFGDSTDKGTRLALEAANARGGIKGRQVDLKTYDDQGKPEEAAVAATRLIVNDKVTLLLGEAATGPSLAMAPIADANRTPMISSSATNPRVTRDQGKLRPYVFRVCFVDSFQGMVMARFARESLKISRVAILRDVGTDYSVGLADFFLSRFKELGGSVVDDQSYSKGDQDFKAQLTAIRGKNPEAVYLPGYYTDVALIVRQARELGIKVPFLGGDGWDSAKLYEIGGKALDGCYFSNHYASDDPSPRIQEFVKRYREKYGDVPDGLAALGHDAAQVALDAMARAKDLSGPAIKEALEQTKDFPGVTGVISIDADHDAVKSAVVQRIEGGKAIYVTAVSP